MLAIVASSATIQNQLFWLFGLEEQEEFAFTYQEIGEGMRDNNAETLIATG